MACWEPPEEPPVADADGLVVVEAGSCPDQDGIVPPEQVEESDDDEDSEEEFEKVLKDLWPLQKLEARLADLNRTHGHESLAGRRLAVLLTTGAMNPPHLGHTGLLQQAATRLREAGFDVTAAWLSPSHDGYVQPKARKLGTIGLSSAFRLEAARRAVRNDSVLDVACWEAKKPGRWPDFPEVAVALQRKLRKMQKVWNLSNDFKVFYACGTDHAATNGLFRGLLPERGLGVVVVPRAGDAVHPEAPDKSVFVAQSVKGEGATFSSTLVRSAFEAKQAGPVVKRSVSRDAADFLLRPTREEFLMFPDDFVKLGIAEPAPAP